MLRMEHTGGLTGVAMAATRVPTFTLYGDGSVIYLPRDVSEQPGGGPELPPLRRATMPEEGVQALLRFALGQGRLLQAREQYRADNVADATSTVFSIDAGGVRKQVDVYALGESEPEGADRQDRLAFRQLAEVLGDFGAEVQRGQATDAGVYRAPAYRGLLEPAQGGFGEARDWPFQTLSPEDFTPAPDFQRPVALLPEAEALRVSDTAYGGVIGVVLLGPDRAPYYFSMRPLLPDELP
ncbi:MAG TPA: hypothetical protein VFK38_06165 [Candidatus Limnocylindrales bacterium]|nr:hypothetical protein [Candidatus Limnocylindrales bacterium]